MSRPLAFTVWILITTTILVVAFLPLDPHLSGAARQLPEPLVTFNQRITDFGTFGWMIYGSGSVVIVAYLIVRFSQAGTLADGARLALRLSSYFLSVIGTASALVHLLKFLIGRARPELLAETGAYRLTPFAGADVFESFPSGHSTAVGAFFGAFSMLVPQLRIPFLLFALTIGISRVIVGAHYPSDVAAGLLLGLWTSVMMAFWFARNNWLFQRDAHGWPRQKARSSGEG